MGRPRYGNGRPRPPRGAVSQRNRLARRRPERTPNAGLTGDTDMSTPHWTDALVSLNACADAVAWAKTQPDYATAWATCERGDWMLWIAGKYAGPPESEKRNLLVLAACGCARLVLPLFEAKYPDDQRVRACIETAERWARGEATLAELREARSAAYA